MRFRGGGLLIGIVAGLAVGTAVGQEGPSPEAVNKAIDRGVVFLKRAQQRDGSWIYNGQFTIGATALGGLALFESGVPRDDPAIVRAERYVLKHVDDDYQTYNVSLAIMFLSKLYPDDTGNIRDLIRRLGWRLDASTHGGMWNYSLVRPGKDFPLRILEPPPIMASDPAPLDAGMPGTVAAENAGVASGGPGGVNASGAGPATRDDGLPALAGNGAATSPSPDMARARPPEPEPEPKPAPPVAEPKTKPADRGKPKSKSTATTRKPTAPSKKKSDTRHRLMNTPIDGDRSNTQFAMIGLWIAGQYGYDNREGLALLEDQFRRGQNADGSWGYHFQTANPDREAMTCVGVLGMYLAATRDREDGLDAESRGLRLEGDRTYKDGLDATIHYAKRMNSQSKAYFLWSVERACVALGKKTLDGFDWYAAGARILLDRQQADGSWNADRWGANADTCLTLLFLRRSNLVEKIERIVRLKGYENIAGLPALAKRIEDLPPPDEPTPIPTPAPTPEPRRDETPTPEPEPATAEPPLTHDVAAPDDVRPDQPGIERVESRQSLEHLLIILALLILLAIPALGTRQAG